MKKKTFNGINDFNELAELIGDRPIFLGKEWTDCQKGLALAIAIEMNDRQIVMLNGEIDEVWRKNINNAGCHWRGIEKVDDSVFNPEKVTKADWTRWEMAAPKSYALKKQLS